jgi:hypothetical protein
LSVQERFWEAGNLMWSQTMGSLAPSVSSLVHCLRKSSHLGRPDW